MSASSTPFVVSARKYRPTSWDEVIGQDAITDTLHNSIEQDHLAHAYLFCGPRGVGKTTCARIFAKEINRTSKEEDEDFSFNIFELDAASNNKVDDIRNLTDQVRIPPQVGKYKVYIIDEVHMLSTQAFNAFLKTLEEPPKHAIFILATTEKHKIIPTILSRCQIYDFNRISVEETVKHLKSITEQEKIPAEEEALHVIAQKADGALRDALSIFDQLVSFTNGQLNYEAVLKNLHVLDYDYYFKLVDYLRDAAYADALLLLDEVLKLGFDANHFITGLGSHLRDLLVCQDERTIALLEVGEAVKAQYHQQAKATAATWLLAALKLTQEAEFRIRTSMNQRLLLEVTLLSMSNIEAEKKKPEPDSAPRVKEPKQPEVSATQVPTRQKASPSKEDASSDVAPPEPENRAATSTTSESEAPSESEAQKAAIPNEDQSETEPNKRPVPPLEAAAKSVNPPRRKKRTTISLNPDDDSQPKTMEEEVAKAIPQPDQQRMTMEEAWKAALGEFENKGNNAMLAILNRLDIDSIQNTTSITIHLQNSIEQQEFDSLKADLLERIRRFTGNDDIQLNSELVEGISDSKLFGPKEKFQHLAEKNPALIKLKNKLDLDITF